MLITKKEIQAVVEEISKELHKPAKVNPFSRESKVEKIERTSNKDLTTVVLWWVGQEKDFNQVTSSKLYQKQGGRYCRTLELLNRMKLERQ